MEYPPEDYHPTSEAEPEREEQLGQYEYEATNQVYVVPPKYDENKVVWVNGWLTVKNEYEE